MEPLDTVTEKIRLVAVTQPALAPKCVGDQTEEICFTAVKQNILLLTQTKEEHIMTENKPPF